MGFSPFSLCRNWRIIQYTAPNLIYTRFQHAPALPLGLKHCLSHNAGGMTNTSSWTGIAKQRIHEQEFPTGVEAMLYYWHISTGELRLAAAYIRQDYFPESTRPFPSPSGSAGRPSGNGSQLI